MKDALTLHRMLLDTGTQHEIVRLPRPISSADQLPVALTLPPSRCLVVRVYDVDATPTAVIVRAGYVPAPRIVQAATGGRQVRAAGQDAISSATGYAAGLVAPLALPDSLPVYADEAVTTGLEPDAAVYTSTGESGTALGIRLLDLFALCPAKPASLSERQ